MFGDEVGGASEAELKGAAEGTKGLALTLRAEVTVAGTAGAGVKSGVILARERASEAGTAVSLGGNFVGGAEVKAGVLVIGVVVCESGVES